jgi:hypothetical protein
MHADDPIAPSATTPSIAKVQPSRRAATKRRASQAALAAAVRELRTRDRLTGTKRGPGPRT